MPDLAAPVAVDGALKELHGALCLEQLGGGGLQLGADSAEAGVALEGVGPAAGLVVQHLEQVASALLRSAQFLREMRKTW